MAEGGEEDITACPVCFEDYEEKGDSIPRLLPCTHTICEKCSRGIIRNMKLECPECRVKHNATQGAKSFCQNKYILAHIRKKHAENKNHESCEKQQALLGRVELLTKDMERRKEELVAAKDKMDEKTALCLSIVQYDMKENVRVLHEAYNELMESAIDKSEKMKEDVDSKIKMCDKNLLDLKEINNCVKNISFTNEGCKKLLSCLNDMAKRMNDCSPVWHVEYDTKDDTESVKDLCGHLKWVSVPTAMLSTERMPKPTGSAENSLTSRCQVVQTTRTGWDLVDDVTLLGDWDFVVSGRKNRQWRLLKYNRRNLDAEPRGTHLGFQTFGFAEVVTGCGGNAKRNLAVGNKSNGTMEVRDAQDLSKVRSKHPISIGTRCTAMCALSPKVVLFTDGTIVKWLDLHTDECVTVVDTPGLNTTGMCCIRMEDEDETLLICTRMDVVRAYCEETGELMWNWSGVPQMKETPYCVSQTTDGRGQLFVCDAHNRCVHVVDSRGRHLGVLLREGDQGLGVPQRIRWCEESSSLILVHHNYSDERWYISRIKVHCSA